MLSEHFVALLRRSYRTFNSNQRRTSRTLTKLRRFTEKEVLTWEKRWLSMSLRRRLWLWRHGFLSQAEVLYDLDEDTYRRYFSDFQRERAYWINDEQRDALNNKLFFHWMMEPFAEQRVDTYGLFKRGRFHDLQSLRPAADGGGIAYSEGVSGRQTADATEWVTERLRDEGELMLKPWRGSDGLDVMRCSFAEGSYYVDGEERSQSAFESLVRGLDGYLVSEVIEQAAYAEEMFPDSANTIRVLTMYDDEADEPFLPVAAHRIGTERSAPLDNFSSGGLAAEVDPETGRLSAASQFPYSGSLDWYENHPDTDAHIEGRAVPGWSAIRDQLLDMATTFSHTPYIGWDIVVTGEGEFTVIEGNNCSGVRVFQVHRPLLDNPRVRRFYEHHGVITADE
jgi:hypothetical protein